MAHLPLTEKKKPNDPWATLMRVGGSAHAQGLETPSSMFPSLRPERQGCVRCHPMSLSRDHMLNLSGFAESVFQEGQAIVNLGYQLDLGSCWGVGGHVWPERHLGN